MGGHRQAFPTPRGAPGGCPPDTVCGGRPRDPRGDGKSDPKGGVAIRIRACFQKSANYPEPTFWLVPEMTRSERNKGRPPE